jgi:hypothetical protein
MADDDVREPGAEFAQNNGGAARGREERLSDRQSISGGATTAHLDAPGRAGEAPWSPRPRDDMKAPAPVGAAAVLAGGPVAVIATGPGAMAAHPAGRVGVVQVADGAAAHHYYGPSFGPQFGPHWPFGAQFPFAALGDVGKAPAVFVAGGAQVFHNSHGQPMTITHNH